MSLKKIMLLFAAGSLVLAGCSDDNPTDPIPEDADDNFITSVVLTVGDNSYAAEIAGNDITVTVPYNVSLDGATAEFEYTPSATIMPDPSTITDWDTERQFRVTSYNGETNDYKYLVVKDDIREEGDVTLKTDAEVKAFADKGVTILKGDLIVGEESGDNFVTDIKALSALTQIGGDVVINNTYKGIALDGLENVVKIGGLRIGSTEAASRTLLREPQVARRGDGRRSDLQRQGAVVRSREADGDRRFAGHAFGGAYVGNDAFFGDNRRRLRVAGVERGQGRRRYDYRRDEGAWVCGRQNHRQEPCETQCREIRSADLGRGRAAADDSLRIRDDFAARTFRGRRRHSVHRQYRRYGNRRYDDEYGSQADRHEQSDPGGRNGLPHGICRTSHSPRSERSYGEGYRTGQSG